MEGERRQRIGFSGKQDGVDLYSSSSFLLAPSLVAIPKTTEYPPCEILRRVRIEKGLTQADLSVLLIQSGYRLGSHFISGFESGHRKPWPAARKAIASVLNMEEDELF